MNLDQIEQGFEQSTRQILNSLGVIQELLKTEKPKKILRKKVSKKKEVFEREQEEKQGHYKPKDFILSS